MQDFGNILINLYLKQFTDPSLGPQPEYRFVEIPDMGDNFIIDLENKILIDLSTYEQDKYESVKQLKLLPP